MKTHLTLILVFLLFVSCQAAEQNNDYTALCTVSDTLAIAKIPITPKNSFTWYKKGTPDNVLEFKCNISLNQFGFGYYLFKDPGFKGQKGSIEQLLLSGQSSIWKKEGNSFFIIEGHGLSVNYSAPYIVMKITDTSTIELLFKEHPSSCSYSVVGFRAPKSDGSIEIQYKE